jgi:hypothetical protein
MPTNAFTEVDYLSEGRGRYTEQFKDKPVFDAYLRLAFNALNELQDTFKDLMQLRSIDTATGVQLDLIGKLIGQPRSLVNYTAFPFFGFDGSSGAETFGTLSDASLGGLFRSKDQEEGGAAVVDDTTYRFLIKARIAANTSTATPEAVISGLNFITDNSNTTIVEQPDAHLQIEVENTLTDLQAYFLTGLSNEGSIVPVPIGVTVDFVFFEPEYFGFLEDPNAQALANLAGGYGGDYGESYGGAFIEGGGWLADLQ